MMRIFLKMGFIPESIQKSFGEPKFLQRVQFKRQFKVQHHPMSKLKDVPHYYLRHKTDDTPNFHK